MCERTKFIVNDQINDICVNELIVSSFRCLLKRDLLTPRYGNPLLLNVDFRYNGGK